MIEKMNWKNTKDDISYSIIWNLFFSRQGRKQTLFGKQEDLLKYFSVALGLKRGEYRKITDHTNIIYLLTRTSNTDTWYQVDCELENNHDDLMLVNCEFAGAVSNDTAKVFDVFLEKLNIEEREEIENGEQAVIK